MGHHTIPSGSAKGWSFSFYMTKIPYIKPHASAAARIAHLQGRGLIIADTAKAEHEIELIGYERLRIYFESRRQLAVINRPFEANTAYEDILVLYACDKAIRKASFEAVADFELLLRNAMSEALSTLHGSHPYAIPAAFKDAKANLEALKLITEIVAKSKDPRAKHYYLTYSEPALPPIWAFKDFLTFGQTCMLLPLLAGPVKAAIARDFGLPQSEILLNWVLCLVDLRNACAHHGRLFNRSFQKQPATLKKAKLPIAPPQKLKAILECLDYMTSVRGAPANVTTQVEAIIAACPQMRPAEAGY